MDPQTGTFAMKATSPPSGVSSPPSTLSRSVAAPPPSHAVDGMSPIGESPSPRVADFGGPSDGEAPPPYKSPPIDEADEEDEVVDEDLSSPDEVDGGSAEAQLPEDQFRPPPYSFPPHDDWGVEQDTSKKKRYKEVAFLNAVFIF